MPRYYFHVNDGGSTVVDEDGLLLEGVEEARHDAILGARDIMAAEVHRGAVDISWRIEVTGDNGEPVFTLPFSEAVQISGTV